MAFSLKVRASDAVFYAALDILTTLAPVCYAWLTNRDLSEQKD